MRLVEFVPPRPHPLWRLCLQMGIEHVVVKVNPSLTGLDDPWRLETLRRIVEGLAAEGLTVVGLEGDPFDMAPVKQFGDASCAMGVDSQSVALAREETLAHYRELLESMAALGIRLLCYNFMVGTGWARTGVRTVRGGARATYFSRAETPKVALRLTKDQVWANYEHFIRAVMPTAERVGVRMGLHPDDPCLPDLGGYARIFGTVADYDRAYALAPSPSNAVTFCQANFKLMGADLVETARHFGKRIAFIHVRDAVKSVRWKGTGPTSRNSSTTRVRPTNSRSCAPIARLASTCPYAATTCRRWTATASSRPTSCPAIPSLGVSSRTVTSRPS